MPNVNDEKAPGIEPKDFEEALSRLENLVKDLEKGELSLESSLARYEEGVRLARFCSQKLEEAEKRIELLQVSETGEPRRDMTGALRKTPLDFPQGEEESNDE